MTGKIRFRKVLDDGQDILLQIWHYGEDSFMPNMARKAGFFFKKSHTTVKMFTTVYPIYSVPFLGVDTFF